MERRSTWGTYMTMFEPDTYGANSRRNPFRDRVHFFEAGALAGERACNFIYQDSTGKTSAQHLNQWIEMSMQ